jgi:hypothetical protein
MHAIAIEQKDWRKRRSHGDLSVWQRAGSETRAQQLRLFTADHAAGRKEGGMEQTGRGSLLKKKIEVIT